METKTAETTKEKFERVMSRCGCGRTPKRVKCTDGDMLICEHCLTVVSMPPFFVSSRNV